ncbi:MAG: alpha/beta hydrolase [bacterium]
MSTSPRVFLIHGFEGTPNGGWRPWLMAQLALKDIFACSLAMPSPENPTQIEWTNEIARAVGEPSENIFLIGHSLGVPAILQYLQSLKTGDQIGGVVLVSGPFQNVTDEYSTKLESFFVPSFDFDRIKNACKQFVVIHGDNDPLVPFSDAVLFGQELDCPVMPVTNGGHLNGSSGWRELPQVLTALEGFFSR